MSRYHNDRLIERKISYSIEGGGGGRSSGGRISVDREFCVPTLTVEQLGMIRRFCQGGMRFRTGPRATFSDCAQMLCTGCSTRVHYPNKFLFLLAPIDPEFVHAFHPFSSFINALYYIYLLVDVQISSFPFSTIVISELLGRCEYIFYREILKY